MKFDFGKGERVVDTGTVGGVPAVFIAPAKMPGEVGASAARENIPLDRLIDCEIVLTFPTDEQARKVADAIVGSVKD